MLQDMYDHMSQMKSAPEDARRLTTQGSVENIEEEYKSSKRKVNQMSVNNEIAPTLRMDIKSLSKKAIYKAEVKPLSSRQRGSDVKHSINDSSIAKYYEDISSPTPQLPQRDNKVQMRPFEVESAKGRNMFKAIAPPPHQEMTLSEKVQAAGYLSQMQQQSKSE